MKILHIIPNLDIGGAQQLLKDLLPLLAEDNEVELVVFKRKNTQIEQDIIRQGILIHFLEISQRSPLAILKLRKFIKKVDIVHSHLFPTHYYAVLANIGLKKPLYFTEHSTYNKRRNHKWLKPVERFVYNNLDRVICVSEATQTQLVCWLGFSFPKNKVVVIKNGIDCKKYQIVKKKNTNDIFRREGKPILMISRFTEAKDHETVVRSIKYVEDSSAFVVFVGDGVTKSRIMDLTKELGVEDRIVFLGSRTDIPEIINAAYIGIQSSNWEGFGLTVVEMMAGGVPVITSDINGLKQVVEGAGILFEKNNPKDLAIQINKLLKDRDLFLNTRDKCLKVSEKYNILKTKEMYKALYNTIQNTFD